MLGNVLLMLAGSSIYKCEENEEHFLSLFSNELLSLMTQFVVQSANLLKQSASGIIVQ